MDFPRGNKLNQGVPEELISSAKVLEEHLKKVDYKFFVKAYLLIMGLLTMTIFFFIAGARLAKFLIP